MVLESDVINFVSSNESELRTPGSPSVGVTKKFHYGWSVNFTSKKIIICAKHLLMMTTGPER